MRKLRCLLAVLVALVFGLSLAVSAEDVPDTAYDESDSLPYEITSIFCIAQLRPVAQGQAVLPRSSLRCLASRRSFNKQDHANRTGLPHSVAHYLNVLEHFFRC